MHEVRAVVRTFYQITSDEWSDAPLQLASKAVARGSRKAYLSALKRFIKRSEKLDNSTAPSMKACPFLPKERGAAHLLPSCWPAYASWNNWKPPPPRRQTSALVTLHCNHQSHST